ncbi:MAG: hypothetical protein ACYTAN_18300 [Planctomycetota bacterium]|jgi:hypothetical protein
MSVTQTDLLLMEIGDLRKVAESYHVKTVGQNREQLLEAVQLAAIRKEEDLRHKVVEAKRAEALLNLGVDLKGSRKRPAPEDVAILASKKVIAEFINREDSGGPDEPGADVTFQKGSFRFHLFDGIKHVLPECLIVEDIEELPDVTEKVANFFAALGLKKQPAQEAAEGVMRRLSLPITCRTPIYGERTLPTGERVPAIKGYRPRFKFIRSHQEAPKKAEFGAIESEVQYA